MSKLFAIIRTSGCLAAIAACTADPAPAVDPAFLGPTCGNGVFEANELCVANPGTEVLTTGAQVTTVLAADLNGDGLRDLVAATASRIWVRQGAALGFGSSVSMSSAGAGYTDVAAGDFDNDGDLDLAAADAGTDRVIVWRNNGGLAFALWAQINVGDNPVRILAARLDDDFRGDLVVFSFNAQEAAVLIANGTPFAAPASYAVGDTEDIALGDCNADGRLDLLYANGFGTATRLNARPGLTLGLLGAPVVSALPLFDETFGFLEPFAIAAGDFDNDGIADAALSASFARLAPATSNGNCTFTPTYTPATMNVTWAWVRARLRTVDWNADGNLDLGAPHGLLGGAGDEVYSVPLGTGAGTFPTYQIESHPPDEVIPKDLAFYDASGDGRIDVLVAGATGVLLERRIP